MQQDDTVNEGQANEYPHKATVGTDAFDYAFALYRSRVHEYFHSLFTGDFSDEQKEDNEDIR